MNTEKLVQFSPSVLAFYPQNMIDDGSYSELPADLIELTGDEQSLYWKQTPPSGKCLGVKSGRPAWVDSPPPTYDELSAAAEAKKARLRSWADSEIDWRQDAVDVGIATKEETAALSEWKKYRVLLMRVDSAKPVWPTPPGEQAS
ncbi:tail fiber assembly protein [Citrobacter portucalensis]|uniref:tail fiber assembly protein n=1 Tax=Citrobacter portucalensis TaxID=1639133 RepID=UPI00351D39AF